MARLLLSIFSSLVLAITISVVFIVRQLILHRIVVVAVGLVRDLGAKNDFEAAGAAAFSSKEGVQPILPFTLEQIPAGKHNEP
jgi:hypothetical protein